LAKHAARSGCTACCRIICSEILRWHPEYWFARELPRHLEGYYAQLDQDRVIERFFNENGPRFRRFIEVGAFDGVHYSNTRRLVEKYGWHGISIEPVRKNYQRLLDSYAGTRVECLRLAASNRTGVLQINVSTYPHLPEWGTDVASLEDSETSRWGKYGAVWSKESVEVDTVDNILRERSIVGFDFISIDVEGHDMAVLEGVDFEQHGPALVIVEYSSNRNTILSYMLAHGYELERDNQQDLFLRRRNLTHQVQLDKTAHLLHPSLLKTEYFRETGLSSSVVSAQQLIKPQRFDLLIKLIYGRSLIERWNTGWPETLYCEHIAAFNGFKEDASKIGKDAFVKDFTSLVLDIQLNGYSADQSIIPSDDKGIILDGAHRTAACALLNQSVRVLRTPKAAPVYNSSWFTSRGLSSGASDAAALEYISWSPNCRFITIFPAANGRDQELEQLVNDSADVVYEKRVYLENHGPRLLVWQIYRKEPWVGEANTAWSGTQSKANGCFPLGHGTVRTYLIEPKPSTDLRVLKDRIRALFNVANHSIHINDSHSETLIIGRSLLNANSVHFLNNATLTYLPNFWRLLTKFESAVLSQGDSLDRFCIDGSAVLSAYGIRDCRDIDFIHTGLDDLSFGDPNAIGSHNLCASYHVTSTDDIIFNPSNHFYFHGIRFVSIGSVRAMKEKRSEGKDLDDIARIDKLQWKCPPPDVQSIPPSGIFNWRTRPAKIVGLVTVRNESSIIGQCLESLARFTNAIIVLDDASTDKTVEVCEDLRNKCNVAHIIKKRVWYRDEPSDRNRLLNAGRSIGGTHFVVIDADEVFTANLLQNDALRNHLLALAPGDSLEVQWIQLWRSTGHYRDDSSVWSNSYKAVAFADNWSGFYSSEFIHTPRIPGGLRGHSRRLQGPTHGLMHFQFVCWTNLLIKQAWYRCLERIRMPRKSPEEINRRYAPSKDECNIHLSPAHGEWFNGYGNFDHHCYQSPDSWRLNQVLAWFSQFGKTHFQSLDIWDVPWETTPTNFKFTNNWFETHETHWNEQLLPLIANNQPQQILEVGSFEGRSTCWFLLNAMGHPASTITCVDIWEPNGTNVVPGDELVFQTFKNNCHATGKANQLIVLRESSATCLPKLPSSSFSVIYIDGDHSSDGVYIDSMNAFRLIRKGGIILWDDYLWSETVRLGVDRACREIGVSLARLGNNVCFHA
jgi:FkbM family methyltransferase